MLLKCSILNLSYFMRLSKNSFMRRWLRIKQKLQNLKENFNLCLKLKNLILIKILMIFDPQLLLKKRVLKDLEAQDLLEARSCLTMKISITCLFLCMVLQDQMLIWINLLKKSSRLIQKQKSFDLELMQEELLSNFQSNLLVKILQKKYRRWS